MQSHKARLSEEWWGLTSEEGRRGPQSRNTCCSQYLVPVLLYIKSKVVQLSIFQRIVIKKESSKIRAVQAQTRDWVSERAHKESIYWRRNQWSNRYAGNIQWMLWVFSQYPSVWSPYFPMESGRKFKEQTLLSRKNLCNILSSCKFNWFLTVLTLEENLNFKDWSSSLHHLWLICEHDEENGTRKLPSFLIHTPFLSLTPLFFKLSLFYKTANYQCFHASSNHLGIHDTLTPAAHHVYFLSFLLRLALLSGRAPFPAVLGHCRAWPECRTSPAVPNPWPDQPKG